MCLVPIYALWGTGLSARQHHARGTAFPLIWEHRRPWTLFLTGLKPCFFFFLLFFPSGRPSVAVWYSLWIKSAIQINCIIIIIIIIIIYRWPFRASGLAPKSELQKKSCFWKCFDLISTTNNGCDRWWPMYCNCTTVQQVWKVMLVLFETLLFTSKEGIFIYRFAASL